MIEDVVPLFEDPRAPFVLAQENLCPSLGPDIQVLDEGECAEFRDMDVGLEARQVHDSTVLPLHFIGQS